MFLIGTLTVQSYVTGEETEAHRRGSSRIQTQFQSIRLQNLCSYPLCSIASLHLAREVKRGCRESQADHCRRNLVSQTSQACAQLWALFSLFNLYEFCSDSTLSHHLPLNIISYFQSDFFTILIYGTHLLLPSHSLISPYFIFFIELVFSGWILYLFVYLFIGIFPTPHPLAGRRSK